MSEEVLVKVEGVSKKFSRNLRKSLKYGVHDIFREITGRSRYTELRKTEFWAVKDVSFELKRGECLGLVGHNGAGKSTLLKVLNGLIKPDLGRIEMKGKVAALIELGAGFNPILTGRENIFNNASVLGFTREETNERLEEIIEFSEIGEFIDAPVQSYSSGMKVRLGFSVVAQMEPDVLIIDEVLAVGDIGFRIKCLNRIGELLENCAVIFVSHSMPQVSRICTKGLLMNRGKVKSYSEEVSEIIADYYGMFAVEGERILGKEKVELEDVKAFVGDKLITDNRLDQGEKLSIEMKVNWKVEVNRILCKVFFINKDSRNVLDCASELVDCDLVVSGNSSLIKVTTDPLYLNGGKYTLSLVLLDADTSDRLYRHDNIYPLNIKSEYYSWSDNVLIGEWGVK